MKRYDYFCFRRLVSFVLCLCMLFAFIGSAMAETAVSVFAATDRHAQYETISIEEEDTESAESGESEKEKQPFVRPKKMPVFDENGALI